MGNAIRHAMALLGIPSGSIESTTFGNIWLPGGIGGDMKTGATGTLRRTATAVVRDPTACDRAASRPCPELAPRVAVQRRTQVSRWVGAPRSPGL
eukprot:gene15951-biopygen284